MEVGFWTQRVVVMVGLCCEHGRGVQALALHGFSGRYSVLSSEAPALELSDSRVEIAVRRMTRGTSDGDGLERHGAHPVAASETATVRLTTSSHFDLARSAAPVWWGRGRWPNVDWQDGQLFWVGWEAARVAWRSVRQIDEHTLEIEGSRDAARDADWLRTNFGADRLMPNFDDPVLARLARKHAGMRPWSAGSHYEGVVSSIVGQSISLAAAATTERRLFEQFNKQLVIDGRPYWPPPRPEQLAVSSVEFVRRSGVTTRRAEALVAAGSLFVADTAPVAGTSGERQSVSAEQLLAIPGIGPWTVRSALLWGSGDDDAHPTGDVALLRATRQHYPDVASLKDLDRVSEGWKPFRAWAARLLWLDLLGFDRERANTTSSSRSRAR